MSGKDPLEDMDNEGSNNGEEQLDNVISHNVIGKTANERGRAHDRPGESRVRPRPGQGQLSLRNCLSNSLWGSRPMYSSAMALNKSQGGGGVVAFRHRSRMFGRFGSRPILSEL